MAEVADSAVIGVTVHRGPTVPLLRGDVPGANIDGHWNKRQREQAHTRHKQHLHDLLNIGAGLG